MLMLDKPSSIALMQCGEAGRALCPLDIWSRCCATPALLCPSRRQRSRVTGPVADYSALERWPQSVPFGKGPLSHDVVCSSATPSMDAGT